jgi:asparagine synthase (glutamine-hydrolysing)
MSQQKDTPTSALEINEICSKLRGLIEEAVKKNLAEGILLSGGLDTSILAFISSKFTLLKAFTVALKGAPAPDIRYASLVAKELGIKHFIHFISEDELYDSIHTVIKTMRSFDPMEVRNSAAIYAALKTAKEEGVKTVMTGDGCDELFAGYSFLFNLEGERLKSELERMWRAMSFSSIPLAKALGLEAKLPYLDTNLKNFAFNLDPSYKIRKERGETWGKWILRKAFEGILPDEVVWRVKTPIEHGSGTTTLQALFEQRVSDEEFQEKRRRYFEKDGVTIRSKEQLFYYEIYRSTVGAPHRAKARRVCPYCNSSVEEWVTYCRTCGAYPI